MAKYIRHYNPELIVAISNDYSADKQIFTHQFVRMARANAISVQRTTAKSAIHGISFIVSPRGKILAQSGFNTTEIIQAKAPVNEHKTMFAKFGNSMVFLIWILFFLLTIIFVRHEKK